MISIYLNTIQEELGWLSPPWFFLGSSSNSHKIEKRRNNEAEEKMKKREKGGRGVDPDYWYPPIRRLGSPSSAHSCTVLQSV